MNDDKQSKRKKRRRRRSHAQPKRMATVISELIPEETVRAVKSIVKRRSNRK
jgi:hypothetical protein